MRTWPSFGLLILASLLIQFQVSAEDLYWEGEEDTSNEFLEVKEDKGVIDHLKRFKRGFWDSLFSSSSTTAAPENFESITEDLENSISDTKDDEDHIEGSGQSEPQPEPVGEKTLRVTFVVVQPYQKEYSNRDSPQFQQFSKTLAQAVNVRFDNLPGTQKASLIRIQSRPSESFSCKVTLDIVTTGFDDTDRIAEVLREHIRTYRYLGDVVVKEDDFSAYVVNPGSALETCQSDEIQCDDGTCTSVSNRCNGFNDCRDGSDEMGCPIDPFNVDQQNNSVYPDPLAQSCSDPVPCQSSSVTICPDKVCNGVRDCPSGDDEENCDAEQGPDTYDKATVPPPVEYSTPYELPDFSCPTGEFRCDDTRCIAKNKVCDQERDCSDGTDEANCPG